MISLDHNHHSSSPQNSKQNDLLQDHKLLGWDDIGPAGDGTDFFADALGVDSTVDINLGDDFSSYIHDDPYNTTSHPPTPVKSTDGTDAVTPLRDRSSSLSPPPDTVSPAPVTGSTLAGEENEEGESGEPQREEEEEDEEENTNGASVAQDGKKEDERRKEEEQQQQFLNATDSLGSPLSELSPPPDQDDDEPAKPEQEEQAQTSSSTRPQNTGQSSHPEATKSPSTTAAQPIGGKPGNATSSTGSNTMNPGAGSSMGAIGGPSATNQPQKAHTDNLPSTQNAIPGPAGSSTTDPRVAAILELNNELFRIGTEFQARGLILTDERWQQYSTRLQSNLTWLAASADQRNGAATLPNMTPPSPVEFYNMERIQQLYSELPKLFAKDIARRQGNQVMPAPASQPTSMGSPMSPSVTPSLKRDRPTDDVPNIGDTNALKRRNTGSGPESGMMPPPSTSPTNPRPPSAASNHSQPPSAMSISSPLSAGPPSTVHMSPPSSTNGLPGSISAPGLSARSTPTPGPGQHTSPGPTSSSTSPRQQPPSVSGLSGPDLMEAQAAAHMRERARQAQIREAQMRAQQAGPQRAHAPGRDPQFQQQKMAPGMSNPSATPGNPMAMGGNEAASAMGMNGMGSANPMANQAPSEIQRQLLTVLQTPGHPMVAYMHRIMPNFGGLPVQQQMSKMWMAQNMIKQQQQNQQNQQNQQGFPNPAAGMNTMPQMSPPPNVHQQQKAGGMGQNPFPTIGVTPSSPAPPQSPVVPQLSGGGGMNNANMFGLDNSSNPMGAGANAPQAGGGLDPRLLPPGMNMNNLTPLQRQQLLMMQQQQQANRGNAAAGNAPGMAMNMGGAGGMAGANAGMGAGMGGNAQNMMGMMTPQQQQQQQQFNMSQQDRQRQQQMGMGVGMPSNPALMAGPSIARSARSPSDTMQNPMTPRMPQQHAAAGAGMQRQQLGTEDYARLMQQQAAQAQRALSTRSPAGFNPQQAGGAGGWQGQQQPGMNMGMNMGGGMGMGMNPQQQQNPSAGYGMSPPGSAGGMYPGASSPTGTSHGGQGPMWSSTANADHGAQMRHMSGTPGPQPTQNMGASGMMDPSLTGPDFDLFGTSNWGQ